MTHRDLPCITDQDVEAERANHSYKNEVQNRKIIFAQRKRQNDSEQRRQACCGPLGDRQRIESHVRHVAGLEYAGLPVKHGFLPVGADRKSACSSLSNQIRSMRLLPKMPYGRIIKATIIRMYGEKSLVPPPTYGSRSPAAKFSPTPTIKPPMTAPITESSPPRIT